MNNFIILKVNFYYKFYYIGNYHCVDGEKATLFRLFEISEAKKDLITNVDNAVQLYWAHLHDNHAHAPPHFKGFNYKSSGIHPFLIMI